jgi:lipoprotein-anchoring transpeptidase ErfK/SrfK
MNVEYFAKAEHLKPIYPYEYTPLSINIPPEEKHIEIEIDTQTLKAYEGEKLVFQTNISSGIYSSLPPVNGIPTETPLGSFHIQLKMPSSHMGDKRLTSDPEAYELPGVPWTCVFHNDGIALHGTYWHNHFGHRMSHGCVNLRNEDALWLFRWTDPVFTGDQHYQQGRGTLVVIT